MTEQEQGFGKNMEEVDSPLPHTPPLGIRAIRPGEELPLHQIQNDDIRTSKERPSGNWFAAMTASIGVVLSIFGTFLPWVSLGEKGNQINLIGWDQGRSAWVVLIAGIFAATLTGALLNGYRGFLIKVLFLLPGATLLLASGIEITDIKKFDSVEEVQQTVGVGLPVIIVGGFLIVLASFLDKGSWKPNR